MLTRAFQDPKEKIRQNLGKTLVYATLSTDGRLRKDEVILLEEAQNCGWSTLIVNNGASLDEDTSRYSVLVINRENTGRDFGAYRSAVTRFSGFLDETIFANSSMYWSKGSFSKIVNKIYDFSESDILFMTESLFPWQHGQTYFIWFSKGAIQKSAHLMAFKNVRNWKSKKLLVWNEELTLFRRLTQAGFSVDFLFTYSELVKNFLSLGATQDLFNATDYEDISDRIAHKVYLNPTIHFAPLMYQGFQIYKASLLRNPASMVHPIGFLSPKSINDI